MNNNDLITKYRPKNLGYVYGHKEAVGSLQAALTNKSSHSFLFTGPSGVGKTTLARLVARYVDAEIREVDAGQYTGIDDMRELLDSLQYRPLGGGNLCIILNEVQGLSAKAWDALLMSVEEPSDWLYWCLTTTEPHKVPATLNRCLKYALKPVATDDIIDLLEAIREAEGWKTPDEVLGLCARAANGSPRQAISNLALCAEAVDKQVAARLLEEAEEPADAVELIRALVQHRGWEVIQPILIRLDNTNPESIRHVCRAYLTKVILGTKDPKAVTQYFELLEHFADSFNDRDQLTPIVRAVGRILFAQPQP